MLINLSDVLSSEDKVVKLHPEIEMEQFETQVDQYPIVEKTPCSITLVNKGKKVIELTGQVNLTFSIPCGRCLEEVKVPIFVEFQRELDMKLSEEDRIKELDESQYLSGYKLDVDKLVYNEILVNWPMRVLCSEDCKGICNRCGTNQNHNHCDCDKSDLDPRMAVISDIFNKFKEV